MPVVSIDLEVLIVPGDCLVFKGFQCGIADLGEYAVVSGVLLDKLRHLFSGWRILDYKFKDGFGKVQALDLVPGHGPGNRDGEQPSEVFSGVSFRFARHFLK